MYFLFVTSFLQSELKDNCVSNHYKAVYGLIMNEDLIYKTIIAQRKGKVMKLHRMLLIPSVTNYDKTC